MEPKLALLVYFCIFIVETYNNNVASVNVAEYHLKNLDNTLGIQCKTIECIKANATDDYTPNTCTSTQFSDNIQITNASLVDNLNRTGIDGLHAKIEHFVVDLRPCSTQIQVSSDETVHKNSAECNARKATFNPHFNDAFMPTMCNLTQQSREITDTPPWIPAKYSYRSGVDGLHTEIEHFNAYMRATSTEHTLRIQVVRRIESIVLQMWPTARVGVFGSYRSGLFLPDSDIDFYVSGAQFRSPLRALEAKLLASDIAEPKSIRVIEKARVPIIKFIDRASQIKVDISFNNKDATGKIKFINEYKRKHPVLSKLVMVLKQFLMLHGLNEAPTGGVSSFSICLLCINFLQLQSAHKVGENANLGVLLLEFLELYGKKFDYGTICIRMWNGGQYLPKKSRQHKMIHGHGTQFLCIEDPINARINSARPSYRAHCVKCAFEHAFHLLSNAISSTQNRNDFLKYNSTLGSIVQVTKKLIAYRKWIGETFDHTRE